MKLGINANDELAGTCFVRTFASAFAEGEVIINRIAERLLDLGYTCPLKRDNVTNADNLAMQKAGVGIELNLSCVSFVSHHGLTPASVRNRRMDFTAPLSFCGRGR